MNGMVQATGFKTSRLGSWSAKLCRAAAMAHMEFTLPQKITQEEKLKFSMQQQVSETFGNLKYYIYVYIYIHSHTEIHVK